MLIPQRYQFGSWHGRKPPAVPDLSQQAEQCSLATVTMHSHQIHRMLAMSCTSNKQDTSCPIDASGDREDVPTQCKQSCGAKSGGDLTSMLMYAACGNSVNIGYPKKSVLCMDTSDGRSWCQMKPREA